jgi:CBS domain-containing protein
MGVCAKDIMTSDVVSARDNMTVKELARLLREHKITGVPVLGENGGLVGVVSMTDIILHDETLGGEPVMDSDYHKHVEAGHEGWWDDFAPEDVPDMHVADIMSPEAITTQREASAAELAGTMHANRIHRIIILDGDRLAGIVSTMDILRAVRDGMIS